MDFPDCGMVPNSRCPPGTNEVSERLLTTERRVVMLKQIHTYGGTPAKLRNVCP